MRQKPHRQSWVSRGFLGATLVGLAATQAQTVIPESVALPSSAVDKTKPGFSVRVFQATGAELPNTLARAENQIAGLLINPATGQPFENIADLSSFNADGTYDEAATIAYSAAFFPGIPGTEFTTINIALEAITYVELNPGTYTMVVTGDDGAKVTTGNIADRLSEILLVENPSTADKVFSFSVSKAGVYPFRLVFEQGGGGYSVNWYTADNTDPSNRVLLNEAGATPSYRALKAGAVTTGPTISGVSPLSGAINVAPSAGVTALIKDGSTALNVVSLKLFRNGTDVTAQATISPKTGDTTKVTYQPPTLPAALSVEEYKFVYDDPTATGGKREAVLTYTVAPYANYTLPAPIWQETFDATTEGEVPAGWRLETPFEDGGNYDLNSPGSDSYLKFVVISKDTVNTAFGGGAARRLNTPEAYINGQKVDSLVQDKFLYGESDTRGGSQVQFAYSPNVNLTGKTDIHLVYNSIYEQNQDSLGAVEYSVDGGTTWLPVVYMLDVPDIVKKPDGSVDAEATLTATNADTADYVDPVTGETIGDTYGSFIGAARETWKDLGPYISGRINDDPFESKRIEKFRLPQADNKAQVSLRFAHAGTGSWYFGVDNVGLYSIVTIDPPSLTKQPLGGTRVAGGWIAFDVAATGQQLAYQWQKNGEDISGATAATLTIDPVSAGSAGAYRCTITNPGGSVTSQEATLTVVQAPQDATSLKTGLGAYLPFENNYNDASGNNRNGTAVGAPTFAAGKVGANAVRVSNSDATETHNYVTLGDSASAAFGQTSDFTVAFWMKTERVDGDPSVVGNKDWDSGDNTGWLVGTQGDGRIEWNYKRSDVGRKDLDYTAGGNVLNNGRWAHVVVVWKINGDAETYLDGFKVNTQSIAPGTGDIYADGTSLNLGQDGTGTYGSDWDGLLDDVAFWDRALTADEVLTLYGYGLRGDSFLNPPTTPPTITYTVANGQLTMNWLGAGFTLQENTNLGNAAGWSAVAGAGANSATVPITSGIKFYRLMK